MDREIFKRPPAEFRGCPFWALNESLDPMEMRLQVQEFHRAGMGGFFLHSRIGLITPYLGEAWMEALEAAVSEAEIWGLKAWLYDEDKWPSGYAGGIIPSMNREYRSKVLTRLPEATPLPPAAEPVDKKDGWNYFIYTAELGQPWFGGACWVDLMNPDAVAAFIASTHEKYRMRLGKYFGTVIPGIFTDEPIMRNREGWLELKSEYVPFSPGMIRSYERNYGTSPFAYLPELFEDRPDSALSRYRYWRTATEQFIEAYTRQIADWCADNGLKLTGHFMYEDSIESQSRWIGSIMGHYRYMQLPGIDHLGLNIDNVLTAKQCSSIASQQGKNEVLSEMFGGAGQNMSFEDRRWIAGWHGIMGIDFTCHHLSLYSVRGCRKRDYPPSFSRHQPYWHEYAAIEDWQSRLTCLLRESTATADFLVIHPLESGWCLQRGSSADPQLKKLDGELKQLLLELFECHRDFDLGDEDFMATEAAVGEKGLAVGRKIYRAVLLPSLFSIRTTTLHLLEQFHCRGGTIISCGSLPKTLDGHTDQSAAERLTAIISARIFPADELPATLERWCPAERRITGIKAKNVWMQRRHADGEELLFLFNISRHDSATVAVNAAGLTEYGLDSGEFSVCDPEAIALAPAETRVFRIHETTQKTMYPPKRNRILAVTGPWQIDFTEPNALVLDMAEWSTDGIIWHREEPCLALKIRMDAECYRGKIHLRHRFFCTDAVPAEICFVAELPPKYPVLINGCRYAMDETWYRDPAWHSAVISAGLRPGVNEIVYQLDFIPGNPAASASADRYGTELETSFLTGHFGVFGKMIEMDILPKQLSDDVWPDELPLRRVIRIGTHLQIGDAPSFSADGELVPDGFPFYAGTVRLTSTFVLDDDCADCLFELPHLDGITARLSLDGTPLPQLLSARPLTVPAGHLARGSHTVSVELRNSLRNLLGPHHAAMGEFASVGPYSFISRDFLPGTFTPAPNWAQPENRVRQQSWTDDYFLVRFGLAGGLRLYSSSFSAK